MTRPLLVDLYCGAGGASHGYHQAGFNIIGIDHNPQPNYPHEFHQFNAVGPEALELLCTADAIHASPPCHDRSTAAGRARRNGRRYPQLIAQTRAILNHTNKPWVIENVEGARPLMNAPARYCGSSFGLDLRRHRLFETSHHWRLKPPPCDHTWQTPRFQSLDSRMAKAGRLATVVGVHGNCNYAGEFEIRCRAMGIDWMTNAELTQAIPPAYTHHIGTQLLELLNERTAA